MIGTSQGADVKLESDEVAPEHAQIESCAELRITSSQAVASRAPGQRG